jgi:REP element-mobilizing transposase RayT
MSPKDYIDFQDQSDPIAYLITIRCYGTWLHGDARGSMDRGKFNRYGDPKIPVRPGLERSDSVLLKSPSLELNAAQREATKEAIRHDCLVRGYRLYALNVRTNHVHTVVSANKKPEQIMNGFKAYVTRGLRDKGLVSKRDKVWSRHGSTKYLWNDEQVERAIDYVLYGQGDELPSF